MQFSHLEDVQFGNKAGSYIFTIKDAKYNPLSANLSATDYQKIVRNTSLLASIGSLWQGAVGMHGSSFVVNQNETDSKSTIDAKNRLKKKVYNLLYDKHNWNLLERQAVNYVAFEGQAIWLWDEELKIVLVKSIFDFNVYTNKYTGISRYALLDNNGSEIKGKQNLKHGVELYHQRDWLFCHYKGRNPSRLDSVYEDIVLSSSGKRAVAEIFANGFINTTLLSMEASERRSLEARDKETNETLGDKIKRFFANSVQGVKNAGKLGLLPVKVDKVIELGKDLKAYQFIDIIEACKVNILQAYNLTTIDVGSDNTTYNNAQSFGFDRHYKIGRNFEDEFDIVRNTWLPQLIGYPVNDNMYWNYTAPANPNESANQQLMLNLYNSGAITNNELRDAVGLDPLPDGDTLKMQTQPAVEDPEENAENVEFKKKIEFAETPLEKLEKTKTFKKFQEKLEKAYKKQLNDYAEAYSKDENAKFPKFETYYSINAMYKDLATFADISITKEKKTSNFAKYALDEIPDYIQNMIMARTVWLIKGAGFLKDTDNKSLLPNDWNSYLGVDALTQEFAQRIIADNADLGANEIAKLITQAIPDFSFNKASIVAQTETANAYEGSRFELWSNEFPDGRKRWSTARDERVRQEHLDNELQGWIPINESFSNGNDRAGQDIACRCTVFFEE